MILNFLYLLGQLLKKTLKSAEEKLKMSEIPMPKTSRHQGKPSSQIAAFPKATQQTDKVSSG